MEKIKPTKLVCPACMVFLEYLSKKPYIESAPLISRLAAWKKQDKEKNGKDKAQ